MLKSYVFIHFLTVIPDNSNFQEKKKANPEKVTSPVNLSQSERYMKVKITKKDKNAMTPEEKHPYHSKYVIVLLLFVLLNRQVFFAGCRLQVAG